MRRVCGVAAYVACAVLGLGVSDALGSAPRWPEPTARHAARASLERMERQLSLGGGETPLEPAVRRDLLRAMLAMADLERSLRFHDARITLLMAELEVGADGPDKKGAMVLFERAIARTNDPAVRARALVGLGRLLGREGRRARALSAFDAALALSWSEEVRALIYLDRGLAELRFLELDSALRDLRLALDLSRVDSVRFEASMLLAVAYERRADLPSALAVLERALLGGRPQRVPSTVLGSIWHSDLAQDEISYAEALVAMAAARGAPARQARRAYGAAVRHWERYLKLAKGGLEQYRDHAEHHLATCRDALAGLGPEPPEGEDD